MPVTVEMIGGRTFLVDVEGDPEDAVERMKAREREYVDGWVIAKGGTHLNLDNVLLLRASG